MKRHPPEELLDAGPLFAFAQSEPSRRGVRRDSATGTSSPHESARRSDPLIDARARADVGAARAANKADRIDPAWRSEALLAVTEHARIHAHFLAEDIRVHVPVDADPRALGAVMQEARRRGLIKPDGYAPSASSNGSPKVNWRSLIYAQSP